jgi:hypothetical protein
VGQQGAGSREWAAGSREQAASSVQQTGCIWQHAADRVKEHGPRHALSTLGLDEPRNDVTAPTVTDEHGLAVGGKVRLHERTKQVDVSVDAEVLRKWDLQMR